MTETETNGSDAKMTEKKVEAIRKFYKCPDCGMEMDFETTDVFRRDSDNVFVGPGLEIALSKYPNLANHLTFKGELSEVEKIYCGRCNVFYDKVKIYNEILPPPPAPEPVPEPVVEHKPLKAKMYEFSIDAPMIKSVLDSLASLVDEVRITIRPKEWHIKCVDPAHVAMMEMHLPSKLFNTYAKIPDDVDVGVDIGIIRKDIKNMHLDKNSVVRLGFELGGNKETDKYHVIAGGFDISHKYIDVSSLSDPKVPNLELTHTIKTDGEAMNYLLKSLKEYSDHLIIMTEGEDVKFVSKGEENKVDFVVANGEKNPLKSMYSMNYLVNMLRPVKGELELHLSTDYPMEIIQTEPFNMKMLLAPRIEGD